MRPSWYVTTAIIFTLGVTATGHHEQICGTSQLRSRIAPKLPPNIAGLRNTGRYNPRRYSFVAEAMMKYDIVDDVINVAPCEELQITYGNLNVHLGNEMTPTQVKNIPTLHWHADPNDYYLVSMSDPDVPSRTNHTWREFSHWLVGNIPGERVSDGQTLTAYVGSGPALGSGFHRYVFLVYKQPGKIKFEEPFISKRTLPNRPMFSIRRLAQKYNLGQPVAGNFYQAQYDDYVPIVLAQLGDTSA